MKSKQTYQINRFFFRPSVLKRVLFFMLFDIVFIILSIYLSFLFRFGFFIPESFLNALFFSIGLLIPLKLIVLYFYNIYHVAWRFFGLPEAKKIINALFIANVIFFLLMISFYETGFPRSVIIIDFFISFVLIGSFRISKRLILENQTGINVKNTLIIGANNKTSNLIKSFLNKDIEYYPVAILSSKQNFIGTYLSNLKVYDLKLLKQTLDKYSIHTVVIAKKYNTKQLDALFEELNSYGIKEIKIAKFLGDKDENLKDISIEDLLARKPKDLDKKSIASFIKDKTILITGAGGSIGSEISIQCMNFNAKKLILVDHSEYNLYSICEHLNSISFVPVLLNVTNIEKLENIFEKYKPDIVIHAAAYKHVPLVEENIEQAIQNNIMGTKNSIDLSIKHSVEKFVLISTDKAVRPTNVMGTTKRVCELYAQNVDSKNTEIVSVRFGNVLGSSGSVIPKFKKQIQNNESITVTHKDITRYFMLIPEACQLVLQSASIARGGELFILDMGEPVKIYDLAKKMIKLYGKENEIDIIISGLRPGEKLYEELLIDDGEVSTQYESITIAKSTKYDIEKLTKQISDFNFTNDPISLLKEIVIEFDYRRDN